MNNAALQAPLEIADESVREVISRFAMTHARVWLLEPPNLAGGTLHLVASSTAQPNISYGGMLEEAVRAALSVEQPASELLQTTADDPRFAPPLPTGSFLGFPLCAADRIYGYLESYCDGPIAFSTAAMMETWAGRFVAVLDSARATTELEITEKGHILIADDDSAIRMLLETLLQRRGYRVTAVSNGLIAYEEARKERPDLILLDWMMPVLDGRATALKLKADEQTRDIPIVMLTSQSRTEDKVAALEAGAQDFLTKPFDSRELVARLEQQLRWRKLLADTPQSSDVEEHLTKRPASNEPPVKVLPDGDFWALAIQAQQLGKTREALTYYLKEAERCDDRKQFSRAALAFRSASFVAAQLQNHDLSNKFLRLSGKMYLCWAETSDDSKAIQDGYVNAARCFLSAGNLKLAKKSVEFAESIDSVMADDRPSQLR